MRTDVESPSAMRLGPPSRSRDRNLPTSRHSILSPLYSIHIHYLADEEEHSHALWMYSIIVLVLNREKKNTHAGADIDRLKNQ